MTNASFASNLERGTDGAVAIVTGAAKRLGKAIAVSLAQNLRFDLVIHYGRSRADADQVVQEVQNAGRKAIAVAADLAHPTEASQAIFEAAEGLGPVRVLINSASSFEDVFLDKISEKHLHRQFAVNTFAPLMLSQRFAQLLPDDVTGHIINLLDWRAARPPATHLAYTASKAALSSLTVGLAQQLAPAVQVNAIAPGAILPPPNAPNWHDERAEDSIPLRRTGSPADICEGVAYLLRSGFITGEVLNVTGGEQL